MSTSSTDDIVSHKMSAYKQNHIFTVNSKTTDEPIQVMAPAVPPKPAMLDRYRALRTHSDELRDAHVYHHKHLPRCLIVFLCIMGAASVLLAVALQIAGLSLPYWLILANIPSQHMNYNLINGNNVDFPGQTSTYYSGLWMFCGYNADTDVFIDHTFCMPAEIFNPSTPTLVIKFNGLVGDFRRTTQGLGLSATAASLVALVGSLMSVCSCCNGGFFGVCSTITWAAATLLSLVLTCATLIYFIITFQLDETKMFYNAAGTTIYERYPYISFYLFVGAVGALILAMIMAGAAIAVARLSAHHQPELRSRLNS